MTLYIQDGAAGGHYLWSKQAVDLGVAEGVIISPFFTPRKQLSARKTTLDFAEQIRDYGGEVIFDATTHGVLLPGANHWTNYNTWSLWRSTRGDLTDSAKREAHILSVFKRQDELGAHHLTPTVALDSPIGSDADVAYELAVEGKANDAGAWQSLAGRRGFWLSSDLDNYIGAIQQLRSPVWFITMIRDASEYPPDTSETAQTAAFCRTVDSLSRRSKVIVCHSDLSGLPAIAAGAKGIGTGWHTKQRVCSPTSYQKNPDQVRQQAQWFTYLGLLARIHHVESGVFQSRDPKRARNLYKGTITKVNAEIRNHHLAVVQKLISNISTRGSTSDRVTKLRDLYEQATVELDDLSRLYGRGFAAQRALQIDGSFQGLKEYATAEGLWVP